MRTFARERHTPGDKRGGFETNVAQSSSRTVERVRERPRDDHKTETAQVPDCVAAATDGVVSFDQQQRHNIGILARLFTQ